MKKLNEKMRELQSKLNECVKEYGLSHPKTVEVSQKLDTIILDIYKKSD